MNVFSLVALAVVWWGIVGLNVRTVHLDKSDPWSDRMEHLLYGNQIRAIFLWPEMWKFSPKDNPERNPLTRGGRY